MAKVGGTKNAIINFISANLIAPKHLNSLSFQLLSEAQ